MTSTDNVYVTPTGSMPISMAVESKPITDTGIAASSTEKDLDYFRCEFTKATLTFYRSTKKVADLLLEARIALSPDEFKALIGELQFDYSTVCKLIKSAADFRLNDPKNQSLLPDSWTLRYEIMNMKEATFRIGIKENVIHSGCTLADIKALRSKLETPKPKKASAKAKTKGKESTAATTAAVKAPVNNAGLRVGAKATDEPSTATATASTTAPLPVGRIAILVSQEVLDQHKADLERLRASIEALVKDYDFIGGVELEVAA